MTILGRIPRILVVASLMNVQLPLAALASPREGSMRSDRSDATRHQFEGVDGKVLAPASGFSRDAWLAGELAQAGIDTTGAAHPAPPTLHQPPTSDPEMSARKPLTSRWWFWTGTAVVVGGVVVALSKRGGDDDGGGGGGGGDDPLPYFPKPPQ